MVLIPAGSFTMGNYIINGSSITNDPDFTNATPTNVYVSAFYMETNLVSKGQWQTVYSYATNHGYSIDHADTNKAASYPVEKVDWYDCVKWCNARSQQAGLTPVYYTDAGFTQVYTNGNVSPDVNWAASGYRLPTEAEWEKAARGGFSERRFPWGNVISESNTNYFGDTNKYYYDRGPYGCSTNFESGSVFTSPVGSFAPNGYGLYDMAGNVEEWCWDWYGTPYGQPTANNPTGPASGSTRILRGGCWVYEARYARCAFRDDQGSPEFISDPVAGFRCVRGHRFCFLTF